MKPITFCVTYFANPELLDICLDSIRRFYPDSRIIISQQSGDDFLIIEKILETYKVNLRMEHNMHKGSWADVAIGLMGQCKTDIAVFIEHDAFLLKPLDNLIELIESEKYDLIGPEEVCNIRNSPGFVMQNFFILNVKKMKEIGLENVRIRDVEKLKEQGIGSIESGYGISQSFDKKMFLPITYSNYAKGMYYGDCVHHLWFGSYRRRDVYTDGVEPAWMETEVIDLVNDYWNKTFRTDGIKLPSSNNKKKYAVCIIAHRESEFIAACLKNWEGIVDKRLVLISSRAWNGDSNRDDGTIGIANQLADEVVVGEWKTEAEQRSWGLARLYDYDYVLIVDADEFYTKEDQKKIIEALDRPIYLEYTPDFNNLRHVPAFKCDRITTYWKTHEYIFDPPDKHKPIIAVDSKQLYCYEHRQFKYPYSEYALCDYAPKIDVTCHHFAYAKSDEKIKEKIQSFSHADNIHKDWYEEIWSKWTPGCNLQVKPYGGEKAVAIYNPAPQEIVDLIEESRKMCYN